ncbi:hypothetical protein ACFQ6S_21880 [Streptomyces sp. NPDC056479]|uniref:hypothetical protein n=1 Tax=Streptomyces sp. NPDC056479 TaxID=3345832 RepID=UPI0036C35D9C
MQPRGSSSPTAHGPAASRPDPSDKPSRAGSRAGEGRERPGREKGPLEDQEAARDRGDGVDEGDRDRSGPPEEREDDGGSAAESSDAADAPAEDPSPATPSAHPARHPAPRADGPAEPVLELLPLGSGLVLIGLGLGLAFVGLRLRRG